MKQLWQKPPGGLLNAYHLRQWIRKKPWPMRRSWFVTLRRSAVVRKAAARNSTVQSWCLAAPTLDSWQPWWEWDILQWWIWRMHPQHPYGFIPKKSRSMSTMQRLRNQQRGQWKVVQAWGFVGFCGGFRVPQIGRGAAERDDDRNGLWLKLQRGWIVTY